MSGPDVKISDTGCRGKSMSCKNLKDFPRFLSNFRSIETILASTLNSENYPLSRQPFFDCDFLYHGAF